MKEQVKISRTIQLSAICMLMLAGCKCDTPRRRAVLEACIAEHRLDNNPDIQADFVREMQPDTSINPTPFAIAESRVCGSLDDDSRRLCLQSDEFKAEFDRRIEDLITSITTPYVQNCYQRNRKF